MMFTLLTAMTQSKISIISPGVDFHGICNEKKFSEACKFTSLVHTDFEKQLLLFLFEI